MPDDEMSVRDALSEGFDKVEAEAAESEPEQVETAVETAPEPAPEPVEATVEAEKPEETAKEPVEAQEKEEKPEQKAAETTYPAPHSWKPGIREHWKSLPADVQQQINRREREISSALRETADSRKLAAEFKETVQPFMQFIEAERSTPIQAVKNMMQTAATLRVGTPQQKAATVAQLIQNFGIDLPMLDNMLAGQYKPDPNQAAIQQQLQPIQQFVSQLQAREMQREQEMVSQAGQTIEQFGQDPKNEFFEDVRETMADLLEIAAKRNQKLDLQTAYDRATMMHPDIAEVVSKRNMAAQLQQSGEPARKARERAVSVKGAPSVGDAGKDDSVRGALLDAIAQNNM